MKRVFLFGMFYVVTVFLWPTITNAQEFSEASENISSFHANIFVRLDSSVEVEEQISYDFGQTERHGIIRDIPTTYTTNNGYGELDFTLYSVIDENGEEYLYDEQDQFSYTSIRIGDPVQTVSGLHWYDIYYKMDHVITGYEDHDELYWNVTGNDWYIPIQGVSAFVYLPEELFSMGDIQTACYTGEEFSTTSDCEATVYPEEGGIAFQSQRALGLGEGMTIVVGFPKGVISTPATVDIISTPEYASLYLNDEYLSITPYSARLDPGTYTIELQKDFFVPYKETISLEPGEAYTRTTQLQRTPFGMFLAFIFPLSIFFISSSGAMLLWWKKGKEPHGRGTIVAQYESPDNLTPAEIGVVADQKAHMHDISAMLVSFAVRGYLRIRDEEKTAKRKEDIQLVRVKALPQDETVSDFERTFFQALFSSNTTVRLSELENRFYTHLPKIREQLYAAVVKKGYFAKSPKRVRTLYISLAILFLFLGIFPGFLFNEAFHSSWYLPAFLLSGALWCVLAPFMSRRTKKGAELYERIQGFRQFLTVTEKARLDMLQSPEKTKELFETLLPYAMALEVEEKWAKVFEDLYQGNPSWYESTQTNRTMSTLSLVHSLQQIHTQAARTFTSAPSSSGRSSSGWSGGSGFSSGGGFSGGGFGGGGGRSW